jgi:hypothetical protein
MKKALVDGQKTLVDGQNHKNNRLQSIGNKGF